MTHQIKTLGTDYAQEALYSVNSRKEYICANSSITRGVTGIPQSLEECFNKFPGVKTIATNLGFARSISGGITYSLFTGFTAPTVNLTNTFAPIDSLLDKPAYECNEIVSKLGSAWLGCLWGTPEASFSCTCPDIGPNFEAYLKLRLNSATFWNTPKNVPCERAEFLDGFKYGKKANVTVAGDFKLKIGDVVELNVDASSGYPYSATRSSLNGVYYIIGVKHVITNSGTHETALSLSQIAENVTAAQTGSTFSADYQ